MNKRLSFPSGNPLLRLRSVQVGNSGIQARSVEWKIDSMFHELPIDFGCNTLNLTISENFLQIFKILG